MAGVAVLGGHDDGGVIRAAFIRRAGIVPVRDQAIPFAVQTGERLLRGFLQPRGFRRPASGTAAVMIVSPGGLPSAARDAA